jgi:dTDP-4-dehydrorhamnose 3,5-epimerase-like enzyme
MKLLTEETSQVNLVMLNPYTFDGWYIHGDREEWHICIKGDVLVALAGQGAVPSGERQPQAVLVPNLVAHGLYNAGSEPAWVIITSDQPHRMGDDDYPLTVRQDELETLETLWNNYYGDEDDATTEE